MKILMVCLGNICRSPIAEGVMKKLVAESGLGWQVDSAGTNGYHTGSPPHRYSQKVCSRYDIDISMQRARRFTAADFDAFDRIYAMAADVYEEIMRLARSEEQQEKVSLFLNELQPGSDASVPDPWYGEEEGYLPVYELIEKTCRIIIKKHTTHTNYG